VRKTADNIAKKGELSNRVMVKQDGKLALLGLRRDACEALTLPQGSPLLPEGLIHRPDRSFLTEEGFFLKRKFLMTSNGKNFCAGCFMPQHHYFDELAEKVCFPPAFTLSLVSCALLERARAAGHDFEAEPYVYTSHAFSLDRRVQKQLRSNDRLHLLVGPPRGASIGDARSYKAIQHTCYGILNDDQLLFRGLVGLAGLQDILTANS